MTEENEGVTPEKEGAEDQKEEAKSRLDLEVEIIAKGECKRHVNVCVKRESIDRVREEVLGEFKKSAQVPGFRPGHVPAALVERRFKTEVGDRLKQEILLKSLEQIGAEHNLEAINQPELPLDSLEIPAEGDFRYEFDVEVRPEFELPDYSKITVKKSVRSISDDDLADYRIRLLKNYGEWKQLEGEPAALEDRIQCNLVVKHQGNVISAERELNLIVRPIIRMVDGEIHDFDKLIVGAQVGDVRTTTCTISEESDKVEMRTEQVDIEITIESISRNIPADPEEFARSRNFETSEEFYNLLRGAMERKASHEQRESIRTQVLDLITDSANWELPESLLRRQMENALNREILEMQQAGYTDEEIRARENDLRQNAITSTRKALKEHFILDKVATVEKIEVTPFDIDRELHAMAEQSGESFRRVRARLEKNGLIENLEAQLRERKAVEFILSKVNVEEVEAPKIDGTSNVFAANFRLTGSVA